MASLAASDFLSNSNLVFCSQTANKTAEMSFGKRLEEGVRKRDTPRQ
jgi:hypothetical protein